MTINGVVINIFGKDILTFPALSVIKTPAYLDTLEREQAKLGYYYLKAPKACCKKTQFR